MKIILLFLLLAALYTIIPDLFLHRFGFGAWKHQYTAGVAITFDDGPSPETTLNILDILDEYQAKATFFVTGVNAVKFPEIIKEIVKRGHQIGGHSQNHKYAWLMTPLATWRDWEECIQGIEGLINKPVQFVRPPWGTFNFITWLWIKVRKKQAILWNVEGHDWQARRSPEEIASTIVGKVKEGSIVVLHDAGGEKGAPDNTVKALRIICRKIIEERKLPLVQLELPDWPFGRRLAFQIWEKWEHYFARKNNVVRINSTNILKLAKTIYKGPDLFDDDGRLVAKAGDVGVEIHVDSVRLLSKEKNVRKSGLRFMQLGKQSVPEMVRYIAQNDSYKEVKLFFGFSWMNHGMKHFGFRVQEMPKTIFSSGVIILQTIIRWIYGPYQSKAAVKVENLSVVWISREQLLERWLEVK
jgi:peptidoglycan/xylan/chitin deacetylase (PgdA/CDA1 family)